MTSSSGWALGATVCAVVACAGCGGKITSEIAAVGDAAPRADGGASDGDPSVEDQCGRAGPEVEETTLGPGDVLWDASVVHVVSTQLVLDGLLHLAPCTIVRFRGDGSLGLHYLDAAGTPGHPITFEPKSLGKHPAWIWVGTRAFSQGLSSPRIENVRFRNAFLALQDTQSPVLRDVKFIGPQAGAEFDDPLSSTSNDLVWEDTGIGLTHVLFVRNKTRDPIDTLESAPPLHFPPGRDNKIGVDDQGSLAPMSGHLRDRGVPYRWYAGPGDDQPSFVGKLTIDPGVTVEFDPKLGWNVTEAQFFIDGTAERPVTLRGHGGKWLGLLLQRGGTIHHAIIADAGRPYTAAEACSPPTEPLVAAIVLRRSKVASAYQDITFRDLPGSAFVESYPAGSADLITGNTFVGVAGCKQIVSRDIYDACPNPVPCAK